MPVSLIFIVDDKDDAVDGGEIAANAAWFRFRRWAMMKSGLDALAQWAEHGVSNRVEEIQAQLKKAAEKAPDDDLKETARVILAGLAGGPPDVGAIGIVL